MKIGVVGIEDGWSSRKLADAVELKTGYRLLVEMDKVRLDLPSGNAWYKGIDLFSLDALIIKKIGARYSPDLLDRLELLRFLSEKGLLICSDPGRILRVLDRLSCTITLQAMGIPMPPTSITEDVEMAHEIVQKYGEAVFKPLYSTKARGMCIIKADRHAMSEIELFSKEHKIMYIQQKVDIGDHDMGVTFLGGKYVGTYARCKQKKDAWNTTTASGGKYIEVKPDKDIIELAIRTQEPFGLDFTCVDVAITDNGPIVFEVSAFGGFRGLLEACGLDAAEMYVDYVISRLNK